MNCFSGCRRAQAAAVSWRGSRIGKAEGRTRHQPTSNNVLTQTLPERKMMPIYPLPLHPNPSFSSQRRPLHRSEDSFARCVSPNAIYATKYSALRFAETNRPKKRDTHQHHRHACMRSSNQNLSFAPSGIDDPSSSPPPNTSRTGVCCVPSLSPDQALSGQPFQSTCLPSRPPCAAHLRNVSLSRRLIPLSCLAADSHSSSAAPCRRRP